MNKVYSNFYRNFYVHSGGYIPAIENIYPGDFFQIRNGQLVVLGNIYRSNVIHSGAVDISNRKHAPLDFCFSSGCTLNNMTKATAEMPADSENVLLEFADSGNYIFNADAPNALYINNWSQIKEELIIKMTQTHFSFCEVYIATESVSISEWLLALAGAPKAELEMTVSGNRVSLSDISAHNFLQTIQSKNIEYFNCEKKRKICGFKAKKLVVRDEKMNEFIRALINDRNAIQSWASDFFDVGEFGPDKIEAQSFVHAHAVDILPPHMLSPNTALTYFTWTDANLDDVNKLFTEFVD